MQLVKFKQWIFLGFFISIAVMLTLLGFIYANIKSSQIISVQLQHQLGQLNRQQQLLIDLQNIENGQRGFVITADKKFLNTFLLGKQSLQNDTSGLRYGISNIPGHQKTFDSLNLLIREKILFAENCIRLRSEFGEDSSEAFIAHSKGWLLMNQIRDKITHLNQHLLTTISRLESENRVLMKTRKRNFIGLTLVLVCLFIIIYLIFRKGFRLQFNRERTLNYNTAIVNNLIDPVITADMNFHIVSWNHHAEKLFGFTLAEVKGKRIRHVLHTQSHIYTLEEIRDFIFNDGFWNGDLVYHQKNGIPVFMNVSTSLLRDEKDIPYGTVSILRDISHYEKVQQQLKEGSELLQREVQQKITDFNHLLDRTTDAFISLDKNLHYVFVNRKAAALHQWPAEQLIGQSIHQFGPSIWDQEFLAALHVKREEPFENNRQTFHEETGQWYDNWIYSDSESISIFFRNITAKKINEQTLMQAQEELRYLNERMSLILGATNEAIWDWDLTTNRIWGNQQYRELIGETHYDEAKNFEIFMSRIHPEDRMKGLELFENIVKEKGEKLVSEIRIVQQDDTYVVMLNRQKILYDKNGQPYRILGSLQDITLRRTYEQQILLEKDLSDTLINSLPGVFYMFNKEGRYLRWNKNIEVITGYSSEEMSTFHPINFVPEDQRAMLAEKIANVFNYGIDNAEADLLTKDNRRLPYSFTGIYINYNGEDCMMGVGIDISERIKVQEELRELASHLQNVREEERARISREIHDELGQLLTGMKIDLSWLNKKLSSSPVPILEKMKELMTLSDEIMKNVRSIATQLRPSLLDDLGLVAALEWQSDEFEKRYNIKTDFFSSVSYVNLDKDSATAIFRIYQESLTNILRHAQADFLSTVLTITNNKLCLRISDNGIGFNEKEIVNKKTLGLLGMKERTLMLKGSFKIESQPDKGTGIIIEIPLNS